MSEHDAQMRSLAQFFFGEGCRGFSPAYGVVMLQTAHAMGVLDDADWHFWAFGITLPWAHKPAKGNAP